MQQSKYAVGEPESVVDVAAEETMSAEMKALVDPMGSGFKWYTPPMASSNKVHESHNGRDWCISGHDMQILMMSFPQKETVTTYVASTGVWMHNALDYLWI